ncbi:mobilization protein MbpA [Zunongwangia sp.]|uniref:mobilization protein MbpA n=1 Tax=Zunongwangia sp. TaxID=1965325 RepID=UPI003AA83A7B
MKATTKIEFRTTKYQKKLIAIRAKKCGLSVSEFCRRSALDKKITERLSDEQIEIYKMLIRYNLNFTRISNMFKKRNPALSKEVEKLTIQIKNELQKFKG